MTHHKFIISLLLLLATLCARAQMLSEQAVISLLTCEPGQELYARYGHTAIRIFDPEQGLDLTFNYGLFDFNTDHFYARFIKGETYYMLGAQYTHHFVNEYKEENRAIYTQPLRLTQEQKEALYLALCVNYEPQNRTYLYNFVFDNCATRPYHLIKNALGDTLHSTYIGFEGVSYRQFISHYTGEHSWADFGINLLFGPKADQPMHGEDRLFLPEELMHYLSVTTLSDGTPLVEHEQTGNFQTPTIAWYADCRFGLSVFILLLMLLSIYDRRRGHLSWGVDLSLGILYILVLLLVGFLTFCSLHPLVGFGRRLLLIPALYIIGRILYFIPQKK